MKLQLEQPQIRQELEQLKMLQLQIHQESEQLKRWQLEQLQIHQESVQLWQQVYQTKILCLAQQPQL